MSCEQKPSRKMLAHRSLLIAHCSLYQLLPYHIQRHGAGEAADTFAVAGEVALNNFCAGVAGYGVKDESNGLFGRAPSRTGNSGDANTECRFAPVTDAFGEGGGHFAANGAVAIDHFGRDSGEFGFQMVRVHDGAAEKVA